MRGAIAFGSTRARLAVAVGVTLLLALGVMALQASPAFASDPTLTVNRTGGGTVTSTPSGINCGTDCTEAYPITYERVCENDPETNVVICTNEPVYQDVTLNASTPTGWSFGGWGGACSGMGSCVVTMDADKTVSASWSDVQNPTVSLTSPTGPYVTGTISVAATASDNDRVSSVHFFVGSTLLGTDTTAPYSMSFNTVGYDGSRTFRAVARDPSGRTAEASRTVMVDNTAPTVTVNSGPNGQTFGPDTTQSWSFTASDAHSGVQSVQCSVVTTGFAPSYGPCSGGNTSHSVSSLPDGDYTFTVRVVDRVGLDELESRAFSIDATPPQTTITSGVADGAQTNQTSLTWDFSSSEIGSSFECRVYPAALTGPAFENCSGTGTHTASGFSPGTYTFEVRATDAVGNMGLPDKRTFTVDTTASNTTITSGPSGTVRSTSASFGFTASEAGSTFQCSLDGSAFAACSSPKGYANLKNGRHTFKVRAIDAAGNVDASPVSRAWTVDTIKPTVSGMSPKHTSIITDTTPTIKATVKDNLTNLRKANIKLYVAGKLISPTKYSYSASTDLLTYNSPKLSKGKKTVKVVATDAAGNVGMKSWYFTIR